MRTTIRLNERLLAEAKQLAARSGRTLTAVIEDALRKALSESKRPKGSRPAALPTFRGTGLQPGVDLDDTSALLDLMEDHRDAD
jgi:hypothetical protein